MFDIEKWQREVKASLYPTSYRGFGTK